jgi:hypothetical protein
MSASANKIRGVANCDKDDLPIRDFTYLLHLHGIPLCVCPGAVTLPAGQVLVGVGEAVEICVGLALALALAYSVSSNPSPETQYDTETWRPVQF